MLLRLAPTAVFAFAAAACIGDSVVCTEKNDFCPSNQRCDAATGICVAPVICADPGFCADLAWDVQGADLDLHVVELPNDLCSSADCSADSCAAAWGAPTGDDDPVFTSHADGERITSLSLADKDYRIAVFVRSASTNVQATVTTRGVNNEDDQSTHALAEGELWESGVFRGGSVSACHTNVEPVPAWSCGTPSDFVDCQ